MKLVKTFWQRLSTPSKAGSGVLLGLGFVGGILFWGAFNTGMDATNSEAFCSGCHAPIVAEIRETYTTQIAPGYEQFVPTATFPTCGPIKSFAKSRPAKN